MCCSSPPKIAMSRTNAPSEPATAHNRTQRMAAGASVNVVRSDAPDLDAEAPSSVPATMTASLAITRASDRATHVRGPATAARPERSLDQRLPWLLLPRERAAIARTTRASRERPDDEVDAWCFRISGLRVLARIAPIQPPRSTVAPVRPLKDPRPPSAPQPTRVLTRLIRTPTAATAGRGRDVP